MSKLSKLKTFLKSDFFLKSFELTKNVVKEIAEVASKPNAEPINIFDYCKAGLNIAGHYGEIFGLVDPDAYIRSDSWKFLFTENAKVLNSLVLQIISKYITNINQPAKEQSYIAHTGSVNGNMVCWTSFNNILEDLAFHKDVIDPLTLVKDLFWKTHLQAVLSSSGKPMEVQLISEVYDDNIPTSLKCQEICSETHNFLAAGFNRSYLFYGPPGSGKSNLVKSIIKTLGLRSIRISNISLCSADDLLAICEVLQPDVLVLEDIDSAGNLDLPALLDKLERLNKKLKLVLATANQASDLHEAMIRPGRFDKPIEIRTLDSQALSHLTNGDEELIKLVSEWPAAYIVELMKRIKVLGREAALSSLEDLEVRLKNTENFNYKLESDENIQEELSSILDEKDTIISVLEEQLHKRRK